MVTNIRAKFNEKFKDSDFDSNILKESFFEIFEKGWKESKKEVIEKLEKMFAERGAHDFCGCYEGDLYDYYKPEVENFLKELKNKTKEIDN